MSRLRRLIRAMPATLTVGVLILTVLAVMAWAIVQAVA